MNSKNTIKILRTAFPYLTHDEEVFLENYQKDLKDRNMTVDEDIKELFNRLGVDVDLDDIVQDLTH